jgi:hypothetical protein
VASLRLRNDSGLTLERGPITIVEDGQYRGEAMLPFTKPDGELVLAFAVELGIHVSEDVRETRSIRGVHVAGSYLRIEEHWNREVTYHLINRTPQDQVVTVEQAKWSNAELADTRAPDDETGGHRRWRVACKPGPQTSFMVTQRVLTSRREAILDQDVRTLDRFLRDRLIDPGTRNRLEAILRLRQSLQDCEARLSELHDERVELGNRQDRLRQNLTIQATNQQEQEIRRRSADEFQRTQDREQDIEKAVQELKAQRQTYDGELKEALKNLS